MAEERSTFDSCCKIENARYRHADRQAGKQAKNVSVRKKKAKKGESIK
jgi:hypothetical protein